MNSDQRFKALLMAFLRQFLELFFPDIARRIDWRRAPEFIDKELPSVLKTTPKAVDLLAKLWSREPTRGASQYVLLIHVEVEARRSRDGLGRRIARYLTQLDEKYGIPVLPIAIFLHVGGDGIGWQSWDLTCWDLTIQTAHFPYVGLPALDGLKYSELDNPIAWALCSLMNVPESRRAQLRCEIELKIQQAKLNDNHRRLLLESVEDFAVLDPAQQRDYESLLESARFQKVREMYRNRFDVARDEGREESARNIVLILLESKFGELPARLKSKIARLNADGLTRLAKDVLKVERLSELKL